MCLHIDWRKTSIFRGPPPRRRAWKVVWRDNRAPRYRSCSPIRYRKGRTISVSHGAILKYRRGGDELGVGLHVYTQRPRRVASCFEIIKVEVHPRDWIADGNNNDAVYSELKVLT